MDNSTYTYDDVYEAACKYPASELYKMGFCDFDIERAVREVEAQEMDEIDVYDDLD